MGKVVAVGDIHADVMKLYDVMSKLEEKIDFDETPVVFLGDYVDGATQARQVVMQLQEYQKAYPHWKFLKGNHEDMMVCASKTRSISQYQNIMQLWWTQGGFETFRSYSPQTPFTPWNAPLPSIVEEVVGRDTINWLDGLQYYHESNSFFFVHAGFKPGYRPKINTATNMMWIREEFIDSPYDWGKKVVFGHTYHDGVLTQTNKIGIDTMHHGRGMLTAVILDDETGELLEIVQSYST